jgi:predicted ABC-type ATPase
LAVERVALRVGAGGHAVPEPTIRQRYECSICNFLRIYRALVSSWKVYDNSHAVGLLQLVAQGDESGSEMVLQEPAWTVIQHEANQ